MVVDTRGKTAFDYAKPAAKDLLERHLSQRL
jgi:hypothetical protein